MVPQKYSFRHKKKAAISLEIMLVDVMLLEYSKLDSQHPYNLCLCIIKHYATKAYVGVET